MYSSCSSAGPDGKGRSTFRLGSGLAVAGLVLAMGTADATAAVIGSYLVNGDGTVTYSYQVDNTGGGFPVSMWSLEFPFGTPDWDPTDVAGGGDVGVPNGDWVASAGIPVGGLSAQDFLSLDPVGDVPLGSLLGGFSFTSAYLPGAVTYFEYGAAGDSATGSTIGPAVPPLLEVPEAGGWLGGLSVAVLAACGLRRRVARPDRGS